MFEMWIINKEYLEFNFRNYYTIMIIVLTNYLKLK